MQTFRSVAALREALEPLRAGSVIALVPTMGALHEGHVALFKAARREAAVVVASVFVNPAQFGDPNDLAKYPMDLEKDEAIASRAAVDTVFAPFRQEMYPDGYSTWVDVEGPASGLEGAFRPGHFRGVATVCLKLFTIVQPALAFFGQKDAQQAAVMKRMVRDLNLPMTIRVVPTVRDRDGLALSSRNARLSPAERQRALAIPKALAAGGAAYREGRDPIAAARALLSDLAVDYVAVADFEGQPTLAVAARVGETRLIDNLVLGETVTIADGEHELAASIPVNGGES